MSEMLLETRNLTKQYGHHKAVDSVNMHIKKGAIYGFIGRSGAGKDDLPEDDQWTFQTDQWRNRNLWIQRKGFTESPLPCGMSD